MNATMNADPRLQDRKQPERRVFCKLDGDESCSVLNLSEGGLCFESLTPIEEKHLLHLCLSVDLNSPIEATGQLAWLDSAKCTGGLRFLELSAPAREQIRAWLSEASTASSGRNGAVAEKPPLRQETIRQATLSQETRVQSTQLVPIERHRTRTRWHFLLGLLLGFGISTAVMIAISQYARGMRLDSLTWTTASPKRPAQSSKAQSSAAQPQQSATQPASPGTSVPQPTAANLMKEQTTGKPLVTQPAALQTVPVAAPIRSPQRQRPQTAGAPSTDLMARTSSPSATPEPSKAEQPLGANQAAVAPAPEASKVHSPSGQLQHSKKLPATPQQLWSSFQAGNMKAAVALADLYARGDGVPVNCEQARVLLQVASKKNNAEASEKLQELDKGGCPANTE